MIEKCATRGVIRSWANPDGTQRIESTGPLNIERMKTVDEKFTKASIDYLEQRKKHGKPSFLWWNTTRMQIWTHLIKKGAARPVSASIPTAWSSTTPWLASFSTS
jgi:arylsulfatase A-like enzyme